MKTHKSTCTGFIEQFLPASSSKRKYESNSGAKIVQSIQAIFKKYLGSVPSYQVILECFEELGYDLMFPNFEYKGNAEKPYITKDGKAHVVQYIGNKAIEKFYINISPTDLNLLRKATKKMPPNTSEEKLKSHRETVEKLEVFFFHTKS